MCSSDLLAFGYTGSALLEAKGVNSMGIFLLGSLGKEILWGVLKVGNAPLYIADPAGSHDVHGEGTERRHDSGTIFRPDSGPVLSEDKVGDVVDLVFNSPVVGLYLEDFRSIGFLKGEVGNEVGRLSSRGLFLHNLSFSHQLCDLRNAGNHKGMRVNRHN